MKKRPATQSAQDYLKRIYELTEGGQPASTNDLARGLKVKPASATGMIQKLAAEKLVEYHKHRGATLTPAGKKAALEVIRHHRLLETWLTQTLGYAWDEVHEEAERLEHAVSRELIERIAAALGNPARDPHGELIPTADLKMPVEDSTPLSSLRPKETAVVRRVCAQDVSLLRHLTGLGLTPGARLQVTAYSPFDNNLTVKVGGKPRVLGVNVTAKIFVAVTRNL